MFNLKIERDEDAESPRDFEMNLGIMICFHKRYDLGDKHDMKSDWFDGWEGMKEYITCPTDKPYRDVGEGLGATHILPLYLMDHSGLAMSCGAYGCPWDSGQVGFIYTTAEKIAEIGIAEENVLDSLRAEVDVYSKYIEGDCWGYVIEDSDGDVADSCWGFYGYDVAEEEGKDALAALQKHAEAEGEPEMYRIVICLDVEARSMTEAYRRVYRKMKKVDCDNFQWESSDEWYMPDGTALEPGNAQDIRMKVFAEESGKEGE